MAKKTLENILADVKGMKDKEGREITEEEIDNYIKQEQAKTADPDSVIARKVAKLVAGNPELKNELKKRLPAAAKRVAYKENISNLRTAAGRSGVDKMKNDFFGAKKRQAKRELERIAQEKRRNAGEQEIDKSRANASISTGRGRHALTAIVNRESQGTHEERHNTEHPLPTVDRVKAIDYKTKDGVLRGAVYGKSELEDGDKVVLFFSGSGGPAGQYVGQVIEPYLEKGAKVVTMDYRGYGNSETHNSRGKKVGTPLSEKSLYKDGKAMLDYVIKNLGVKPENIILHGYSMGGAVASKVAADFAQEQQKRALQEGRSVHKLGGFVLHSPMSTLYEVASEDSNKVMGAGAWMFGGGYNTRSHMRRLHQFDPDIPVHYVSGDYMKGDENGDYLDIAHTKIHEDPSANFANSSVYRGTKGHTDNNVTTKDDPGLALLVEQGRNAKLNDKTREITQTKQTEMNVG